MCLQVEQDAVDLEGEGSPGFNTAEALRALLVKKRLITPEVLWGMLPEMQDCAAILEGGCSVLCNP